MILKKEIWSYCFRHFDLIVLNYWQVFCLNSLLWSAAPQTCRSPSQLILQHQAEIHRSLKDVLNRRRLSKVKTEGWIFTAECKVTHRTHTFIWTWKQGSESKMDQSQNPSCRPQILMTRAFSALIEKTEKLYLVTLNSLNKSSIIQTYFRFFLVRNFFQWHKRAHKSTHCLSSASNQA